EAAVEVVLERAEAVVRRAALGAAVDEVQRLAVDDERPDHAALDHPVEVAGPLLDLAGGRTLRGGGGRQRSGGRGGGAGRAGGGGGGRRERGHGLVSSRRAGGAATARGPTRAPPHTVTVPPRAAVPAGATPRRAGRPRRLSFDISRACRRRPRAEQRGIDPAL